MLEPIQHVSAADVAESLDSDESVIFHDDEMFEVMAPDELVDEMRIVAPGIDYRVVAAPQVPYSRVWF
jgi:hypothetical protein